MEETTTTEEEGIFRPERRRPTVTTTVTEMVVASCLLVLTRENIREGKRQYIYNDEDGPILGTQHEQETYVFDFGIRQDVVHKIVSNFRSYLRPLYNFCCWISKKKESETKNKIIIN